MPNPSGNGNQGFHGMRHIRVGDTEVMMAALFLAGNQPACFELCQVPARGG